LDYVLFGKPGVFRSQVQFVHPELEIIKSEEEVTLHLNILAFYPSTEKLKRSGTDARVFRGLVRKVLEDCPLLAENLPDGILSEFHLPGRFEALKTLHFPKDFTHLRAAKRRVKFEEVFFFELMLAVKQKQYQPKLKSPPFEKVGTYLNTFYKEQLPFSLTEAQKKVIREIRQDLAKPYQMNRLLQGDVGSGKTMVALMSMLIAADNGFQSALLTPTEILSEQHYKTIQRYCEPLNIKVCLLTGSVRQAEKNKLIQGIADQEYNIVIGTHALLEKPVIFKNLGLTIIDEQHKFGVLQRARLWQKGKITPHNLAMTATPIPRTLAMTLYGDLNVSVINELPPGRKPIQTRILSESRRLEMLGFVRKQLSEGHRAYFVYPLIETSEKIDLKAATEGYLFLKDYFAIYGVGLVHGRMEYKEKEAEMLAFASGKKKVLVSTTVIEVGVDVPEATVMVIENAERFGLSQLHQLRGRVGRGAEHSFCLLMPGNQVSKEGILRLKAMESTQDGFKLSEIDLEIRGPGDLMGIRQSGMPEFRLADLSQDQEIILAARNAAFDLIERDSELLAPENKVVKAFFHPYFTANKKFLGLS